MEFEKLFLAWSKYIFMSKQVIKNDELLSKTEAKGRLKGKGIKGFEASTTTGSTDEDQEKQNDASTETPEGK
jgi:hypothetical protein